MSNRWQYRLKLWIAQTIAGMLPEIVKRFVLYDLHDRASRPKMEANPNQDYWDVSYVELYDTLKD